MFSYALHAGCGWEEAGISSKAFYRLESSSGCVRRTSPGSWFQPFPPLPRSPPVSKPAAILGAMLTPKIPTWPASPTASQLIWTDMGCSSPASLCSRVMMSPTALCAPALPFIGTCPVPSLRPQGRRGHKGGPMNALWQPGLLKSTHAPRQRVQEATPRSEPAPLPGPRVLKRHHSSDKQLAALSLLLLPMTPGAASTSLHPALLDIPSLASEIPSPNPESGGKPKPPQGPPGSLQ